MSFIKARNQRQEDSHTPSGPDHTLMCRVGGCGRLWSVDINHGRVCSFHDEQFSRAGATTPRQAAMARGPTGVPWPKAPPTRPFIEPDDDQEAA